MTLRSGRLLALACVLAAGLSRAPAVAQTEEETPAAPAETSPDEPRQSLGIGDLVFAPPANAEVVDEAWLWGETAILRGLDKVTAETRDFEAPVGEDVAFFALTVSVKRCAKRPPEMQPETIVGLEIYDRRTDGAGAETAAERVFSGWMFGSNPALNPLEHPVFDLWVVDCIVPDPPPEEVPADPASAAPDAPAPATPPGD